MSSQLVNERTYRRCIDSAEKAYEHCWKYLCDLKTRNFGRGRSECLTEFQPHLGAALASLSRIYDQIAGERKRLIDRKHGISEHWFEARQRLLSKRQKVLKQVILTGRCLGDAFAWFFYQRDRRYLRDHLSQQEIIYSPSGIGGIGELEFVRNIKLVSGYFIVYHGITSILRLGDVSLIDLKTLRVVGIGELKSRSPTAGTVEITLIVSGPGLKDKKLQASVATPAAKSSKGSTDWLSPANRDRLNRQLKRIGQTFKSQSSGPNLRMKLMSDNYLPALEQVVRNARKNSVTYARAGEGLLLINYTGAQRTLRGKCSGDCAQDITERLTKDTDLSLQVQGLIRASRSDNSIVLGSLVYDQNGHMPHLPGMAHLFWWELPLEVIRKIIFHDALVMTVFNPATLIDDLEQAGYTIFTETSGRLKVTKRNANREIEVSGIDFYFRMIQQYLFSNSFILRMLAKVEDDASVMDVSGGVKLDLLINQEI